MKKQAIFVLVILISFVGYAQSKKYSDEVKACLKSNGTYAYYEDVIDQMFNMLQKQYASQNVPSAVWSDVLAVKPQALDELGNMLIGAYEAHYSHKDVKRMNALYQTIEGKRMISNPKDLTEEDKANLNKFYASSTGQKVVSSQESMNKIMSEITEKWSSELYQKVVNTLSDKGFVNN